MAVIAGLVILAGFGMLVVPCKIKGAYLFFKPFNGIVYVIYGLK